MVFVVFPWVLLLFIVVGCCLNISIGRSKQWRGEAFAMAMRLQAPLLLSTRFLLSASKAAVDRMAVEQACHNSNKAITTTMTTTTMTITMTHDNNYITTITTMTATITTMTTTIITMTTTLTTKDNDDNTNNNNGLQ